MLCYVTYILIMIISNIKNNECTCMWNSSKNLQKLKQCAVTLIAEHGTDIWEKRWKQKGKSAKIKGK